MKKRNYDLPGDLDRILESNEGSDVRGLDNQKVKSDTRLKRAKNEKSGAGGGAAQDRFEKKLNSTIESLRQLGILYKRNMKDEYWDNM